MKRLLLTISLIAGTFVAFTSCEEPETESPKEAIIVTGNAEKISAVSVMLKGKANLPSTISSDMMIGFHFSTSSGILPSNSTTIEAVDADANYNFSATIKGLTPGTKYYYRCFIRQGGIDTYGETKEFSTKAISSVLETLDASNIEATKATLNAKLDLTDIYYSVLEYGFLWGETEELQTNDRPGAVISDNAFATILSRLNHKTQYWFKSYVTLDGNTYHGAVKSFTTSVVPVTAVVLNISDHTFHTIGDTVPLNARVTPNDATDQSVKWSSDNTEVATVDTNGLVTAVGNGNATITVTTNNQNKTASCAITVSQYVTGITIDKTSLTLLIGENETLSVTNVMPSNAYDKTYTWITSDKSVATVYNNGKVVAISAGTAQIRAIANDGSGVNATCDVKVKTPITAVDLGLSVKWANCNLGANRPEQYGGYYAWGETKTKSDYLWETYKWCSGNFDSLTKYNFDDKLGAVDNKTVLDLEDDAAHANLGGNWRMPTKEEWAELKTKCTWTWTTENDIYGHKVTGPNGNSIFLPAAGYYARYSIVIAGSYGEYWSSSLYTGRPDYASSQGSYRGGNQAGCHDRCYGLSIRPVTE